MASSTRPAALGLAPATRARAAEPSLDETSDYFSQDWERLDSVDMREVPTAALGLGERWCIVGQRLSAVFREALEQADEESESIRCREI